MAIGRLLAYGRALQVWELGKETARSCTCSQYTCNMQGSGTHCYWLDAQPS